MNEHLVRPHPAPLTPAGMAQLHADATNWRALLIELAERGFTDMTLEDIVAVFPNFREMACTRSDGESHATVPRSPHAARSAYLDAFLTPDPLPPSPIPPLLLTRRDKSTGAIAPAPAVAVLDFAEAATTLGAMNIGYTRTGQLAFTFQETNQTYLVPFADIVDKLIDTLLTHRMHQPPQSKSRSPRNRIM